MITGYFIQHLMALCLIGFISVFNNARYMSQISVTVMKYVTQSTYDGRFILTPGSGSSSSRFGGCVVWVSGKSSALGWECMRDGWY